MQQYLRTTLERIPSLLRPTFFRPGKPYSRDDFKADLFAGITVAIIQVPQSMALALIAGLPAVYGLYASLPGCIASIWGSSTRLSTGPVAILSFLTFISLSPLATPDTPQFIQLAATLALLVGIIYFLMGFFRLGFVFQLVPQSVILGFSSAAAVIIIVTQLPTLFGIPTILHGMIFRDVTDIVVGLPDVSFITAGIGIATMAFLMLSRRFRTAFPGALVVLALATLGGYVLGLGTHGVALVREVPNSLPAFFLPWLDLSLIVILLPKAAIIAVVGFVGAHASAKIAAQDLPEKLETNQELVGQGLANIATAFFQGFPLGGSFTRTAINVEAGARSAVASIVTAAMTVLTLLFLTPYFYHLPRTVLAAIVIIAAIPIIDIRQMREMYRISFTDGVVAFFTFGMVFIVRADDALFLGIATALILFIRQTVWGAHVTEMGVDRDLHILRGAAEGGDVDTFSGVAITRIGMSVYYANAAHVVEEISAAMVHNVLRDHTPIKTLVLDFSGVNFLDISGIEILKEYFETLKDRGIRVAMIYLRPDIQAMLGRVPDFPQFKIFRNIDDMRSTLLLSHK